LIFINCRNNSFLEFEDSESEDIDFDDPQDFLNELDPTVVTSYKVEIPQIPQRVRDSYGRSVGNSSCETPEAFPRHIPPLGDYHMQEIFQTVGLMWEWFS
ncbi:hypothetical protein TELCIR_17411, partial [Teladorsagia circumcincta]